MAFFDFINTPLNILLGPLLSLPTLWAIIALSFLIALLTTLIYKWTTNQQLMKELKDEIKALQAEAKELKNEPQKAMEVQKKAMETNMKYMSHSMKPTLITFLPIIIIFGWMTANFAYEPTLPNQEFSVIIALQEGINGSIALQTPPEITLTGKPTREITNGETIFTMKSKEGQHTITFRVDGAEYNKEILVTEKQKYLEPQTIVNDKNIKTITTNNKQQIVLNLFGWQLGWLGTYIIFSIIFSIVLRKWMKIH